MKKLKIYSIILLIGSTFLSCDSEIRNITGDVVGEVPSITNPEITPFDINQDGFDLLEKMQGHWVGTNLVIADDFPWFAFDYRAISPSQIHGIFEGGSMGNLLTSFFVTDFKGTRTIMARNGGVLNGIYRTSYFVLDKVENRNDGKYYRLIDAIGGTDIMYMELRFDGNELFWNAYTSGLGNRLPTRHMTFKGAKTNLDLANTAAQTNSYPQNTPAWDFSNGFREDYLYIQEGNDKAKSATFLSQQNQNNVFELAELSGDPYKILDHPYLGFLQIDITRNNQINDKTLLIYLSKEPLTDQNGYLTTNESAYNSILLFPALTEGENQFLVTYLHPGDYYVTVVADMNNDAAPSQGDIVHPLKSIKINPEGQHQITIDNITVQN